VLNKEIPFLRICVPLCLGIIAGLRINPGVAGIIFLMAVSVTGFFISVFFNNRLTNIVFGIVLFIALFSSGLILYDFEKDSLSSLESKTSTFYGTLTDYPAEKEKSYMITLKLSGKVSPEQITPVKGSIVLYHKKDSLSGTLKPGDILIFRCTPQPVINRGNPYEFNYRFYMESRGIRYYAFSSRRDIISVTSPEARKLKYSALIIRNKIIGMYEKRGITGKRLALAAAITLGEKEGLDPEQKQDFIKAGVMHIMAVSGLHAMILSLFVFNLLFFLKRRFNILRVLITILFLWVFAFITGLTPSVLRATLMFSFLQAGTLLKRRVNGINSILASAFILILFRPSVIFDAGFLLSYSAVLFIIAFYNEFHNLILFKNRIPDMIWQSVAVTIVAQAGTLPLTIMLFNRFPTLFILTNAVIVPLSSVVVITGCIIPFIYPMVHISGFLAIALDRLTGLTEYLTSKAASVPWSTIENIGLSMAECVTLFLFISLTLTFLIKKPGIKPVYPLAALLCFALSFSVKNILAGYTNELIVYNTPGYATIGLKSGKHLLVFSDNPEIPPEVKRHGAVLGLKTDLRLLSDSILSIEAGKRSILICNKPERGLKMAENADIIIITGRKPFARSDLPNISSVQKQEVILAVSGTNIIRTANRVTYSNNRIRSVKESGAIREQL
jgi:competence protein ComEC